MTNDFLPFCETDNGSNLLSQADYIADAQRLIGNQPGIARAKLVNKALRQSSYIIANLAQYLANATGNDVLDDETPSEVLATLTKAFGRDRIRYTNTSGQTLTNGVESVITNWTVDYDANSHFNPTTGIFTCPAGGAGAYKLYCSLGVGVESWTATGNWQIRVQKNGTPSSRILALWNAPSNYTINSIDVMIAGEDVFNLVATDTLAVSAIYNDGNGHPLSTNPLYNVLRIEKLVA